MFADTSVVLLCSTRQKHGLWYVIMSMQASSAQPFVEPLCPSNKVVTLTYVRLTTGKLLQPFEGVQLHAFPTILLSVR